MLEKYNNIEIPAIYKALDKVLNFKNFPRNEKEINDYGREELALLVENYHDKFLEMMKDPIVDPVNLASEFFSLKIQFYNNKDYRKMNFCEF